MSVRISLENSRYYQRDVVHFFGGGAIAGAVAFILHLVAGAPVSSLLALSFGSTLGLMSNLMDSREGTPMLRLVLSVLAGVVMMLTWNVEPMLSSALCGAFLSMAFTLGEGTRVEKLGWAMLFSIAMVGGVWVSTSIGFLMLSSSTFAFSLASGAIWGLFLSFAAGLRRLRFDRDELWSKLNEAEKDLRGEEAQDIRQGRALYEAIQRELERTKEVDLKARALAITRETTEALVAFARRAEELQTALEVTRSRQLEERAKVLRAELLAIRDQHLAREVEATLREVVEQIQVNKKLEVARRRIEAKKQRCFTALERLHVSLLQGGHGAADSALAESVSNLERLTDEVEWRNLSVDELVGDEEEPIGGVEVILDTEPVRSECSDSEEVELSDGTDGSVQEESSEYSAHRAP